MGAVQFGREILTGVEVWKQKKRNVRTAVNMRELICFSSCVVEWDLLAARVNQTPNLTGWSRLVWCFCVALLLLFETVECGINEMWVSSRMTENNRWIHHSNCAQCYSGINLFKIYSSTFWKYVSGEFSFDVQWRKKTVSANSHFIWSIT